MGFAKHVWQALDGELPVKPTGFDDGFVQDGIDLVGTLGFVLQFLCPIYQSVS